MFSWRITKYNPFNRDMYGVYQDFHEWTSYSDIQGNGLSFEKYVKVECSYIEAVIKLMACNTVKAFTVVALEKRSKLKKDKYLTSDMIQLFADSAEGNIVNSNDVRVLISLILREKLWCKLESDSMYVHFGYDYYMYIGSMRSCENILQSIKDMGLFVEAVESPYKRSE